MNYNRSYTLDEEERKSQQMTPAAGTPMVGRFGLPRAQVGGGSAAGNVPTIERLAAPQRRMEELQQSSYYRQASPAANRRMEQAVSMGLSPMANPADWTPFGSLGIDPSGRNKPMGYLPPQGGFGTFGSVGMDRERKGSTGRIQSGAPLGSAGSSGYDLARRMQGGGPQPAEATPTPAMPSGGSPLSQTGFGEMMRKQEEEEMKMPRIGSLTGFGRIPNFPFSNY